MVFAGLEQLGNHPGAEHQGRYESDAEQQVAGVVFLLGLMLLRARGALDLAVADACAGNPDGGALFAVAIGDAGACHAQGCADALAAEVDGDAGYDFDAFLKSHDWPFV